MRLHAEYNDLRHKRIHYETTRTIQRFQISQLRRGEKCLIIQHLQKFREGERKGRGGGGERGREKARKRERANGRIIIYITCKSWYIHTVPVLELSWRFPKSIFLFLMLYGPYLRPVCRYRRVRARTSYLRSARKNIPSRLGA